MPRTVAIGEQDFSKIIENNYFYIDKTNFIREWWESGDTVTLITRPRRFGKTLTMRMVEQFFSVNYAGSDLFKNLSIWKEDKYRELQGTYPVIFLSFANVKANNYEDAREGIIQEIVDVYNYNSFLLDSDKLTEHEKELFQKIDEDMSNMAAARALLRLSAYLNKHYGKKVIILLDEYDTPMQEAYANDYWGMLVNFIRSLMNSTFKTNPFLERGLMTGITRVSKESVFSDLNNLEVITTTSGKYVTVFGFTEEEVLPVLEEFGLQDKTDAVKQWYDGFRFGDCNNIYNPWSIAKFLDGKIFAPHWANTSSNRLVGELIRKGNADVKLAMEDLLTGKDFSAAIDEEIVFDQLDKNRNAIWSFLLASGYLKFKGFKLNQKREKEYVFALTNLEVCKMFEQMFVGWFSDRELRYGDFSDALLAGDKTFMQSFINQMAGSVFSHFDTGRKTSEFKKPENFYHGFVLGLIADLREIYDITSNRESGYGRYDVILEPKYKDEYDGIVIEFKVFNPETDNNLKGTVQNALQQILDKKYAATLEAKSIFKDRIRIYGFAFKGKDVLIDGGYLNEIELHPTSSSPVEKLSAF